MMERAVFLDKDGTLIEDVPYNVEPNLIRLTGGAAAGLRSLQQAGFLLVVVSNQSGVARGYFSEAALIPVEQHLRALLAAEGIPLAGFYYCPHHPHGTVAPYAVECMCRKPAPGLLRRAAAELGIDLARSWMIGDNFSDVESGRHAGCRTILLQAGDALQARDREGHRPHATAVDLELAARIILEASRESFLLAKPR
jgi:D,D-heptose 1,7-bisphosphate phosphatase